MVVIGDSRFCVESFRNIYFPLGKEASGNAIRCKNILWCI
jgi:hypothetical protein